MNLDTGNDDVREKLPPQVLFDKAAELIQLRGWRQGAVRKPGTYPAATNGHPVCLSEACAFAVDLLDPHPVSAWRFYRDLRDRVNRATRTAWPFTMAVIWNDSPGRKQEQVMRLLKDEWDDDHPPLPEPMTSTSTTTNY